MMNGVAGFHSLRLGLSERVLSGVGIREAQKLGWTMRGKDMKRGCDSGGANMAKARAFGRVGASRAVRWPTGMRSSWRNSPDGSMARRCFDKRAQNAWDGTFGICTIFSNAAAQSG